MNQIQYLWNTATIMTVLLFAISNGYKNVNAATSRETVVKPSSAPTSLPLRRRDPGNFYGISTMVAPTAPTDITIRCPPEPSPSSIPTTKPLARLSHLVLQRC